MVNKLSKLAISAVLTITSITAHSESLMEIYELALENDPTYLAAEAANKATRKSLSISNSSFFPSLAISATGSTTDETSDISENYSATITQKIYNWGDIIGYQQAKRDVKIADADLKAAKQDLIIRVAESYFSVLSAKDNITFTRAEKQAIARQLDQAKQRFDVGLVAITDVHEAQARYDLSVATGIAADNELDAALESLREITGQYHDDLSLLDKNTMLLEPNPNDIAEWTKKALENNLVLYSARLATEKARESISLQRAGYHPTLGLNVAYNSSDSSLSGSQVKEEGTSITLTLGLNLYSGGITSARTDQAQHHYQQSKEFLERETRKTQRMVRNAYLRVIADISRIKALQQAVVSSRSALRASEAGFEVGTRTTVDVLQSRQQLFSAQTDHAQARYNYIDQLLRLKRAAGSLDKKNLEQVNGWLIPSVQDTLLGPVNE